MTSNATVTEDDTIPNKPLISSTNDDRPLLPVTPSRQKRLYTRSSVRSRYTISRSIDTPRKRIYLFRHGQSLAQTATSKSERQLQEYRDCKLSDLGRQQAMQIPKLLGENVYNDIQLVVCSPLTRAVETAIIGFDQKPIIVHYDLREVGTMVSENIPRSFEQVIKGLGIDNNNNIDFTTLQPNQWPKRHDASPRVVRRDQVRRVFEQYLWHERQETCIAVVCHYHVIRAALQHPYIGAASSIKPENAQPIECILQDGILYMTKDNENVNVEATAIVTDCSVKKLNFDGV